MVAIRNVKIVCNPKGLQRSCSCDMCSYDNHWELKKLQLIHFVTPLIVDPLVGFTWLCINQSGSSCIQLARRFERPSRREDPRLLGDGALYYGYVLQHLHKPQILFIPKL